MGGYGSGTWFRWGQKQTTESRNRIDLRWLKKEGALQPGVTGFITWSKHGELTASLRYQIEKDQMEIQYKDGESTPVAQTLYFYLIPCNYGGYRTWFRCPDCYSRVAVLYVAGKHFRCRCCSNLTYSSQQTAKLDRVMHKARKIRRRLGASDNLFEPILFKPKNMHQKTFYRLCKEAEKASNISSILIGQRIGINV